MLVLLGSGCAGTAASRTTAHQDGATPQARTADARDAQVRTLLSEGLTLARQHRAHDAEASLRRAIALSWGFGRPWSQYRARGLSELARALLAQGRAAEARATAEDALALLSPGALADDQQISELQTTRGEALRSEQQLAAAVTPFSAALQATTRHPAELAPALIAISLRLAETLELLGRRQDAKQVLERAQAVAKQPAVGAQLTLRLRDALAGFADTPASERPSPVAASPNTLQQVAALQAEFRACYHASLAEERDVSGRVALVLSIAADGHVSNVRTNGSGLPVTTVDCLVRRASLAHFEPPKGGSAVITVPVTFVQQEND
jgi:tetratricopeptide (TPR) repeat protein